MRVEGKKNKAPVGKRTGIHELRLIELFTHYTGLLAPLGDHRGEAMYVCECVCVNVC